MISSNLRPPVCSHPINLFLSRISDKDASRLPSKINNSQKLIPRWQTKFLAQDFCRFPFPPRTLPPRDPPRSRADRCAWTRSHTRANLVSTCAQMCVLSRHSREKTPWRNNRVVCNARRGIVRGCKRRTWWGKEGKRDVKEEEKEEKEEEEKEEKKEKRASVFHFAGAKCASPLSALPNSLDASLFSSFSL